jgi:hypothetical protein
MGMPSFTLGSSLGFFLWSETSPDIWKLRCVSLPGVNSNFGGIITANGAFESVTVADLEPYTHGPRGARLYRNDGSIFVNVTQAAGLTDSYNVRNVTWIDYDLDGDLDLHVHNKGDSQVQNHPDILYRNQNGNFANATSVETAPGPLRGLGDGASFEDVDGDGDPDLAVTSGASPRFFALQEIHRLYENRARQASFLRVNLEGTASTRDGYGAWVTCVSRRTGQQVHYVAGNSWGGSQIGIDPVFGLKRDQTVDRLRVEWPSGVVTEFTNVPPGVVTVTESGSIVLRELSTGENPSAESLLQLSASPNPSTGRVVFEVRGRREGACVLEIVDTAGRQVFRTSIPASSNEPVFWDGRDRDGHRAASGVYYSRVRDGSRSVLTKVTLMR